MKNKYVDFIPDAHLIQCISHLYSSYIRAKAEITKSKFFKNKIDIFKLTFDTKFNGVDEKSIINSEILRQIDKSINNSIGTFHEQILGGIDGFEIGNLSGFDIKALDNTLFADIKNKHNTMNSSAAEALFQKLARYADDYKQAKCYWVQILAKGSFHEVWIGDINGKEYSHTRVYKISGDKFYTLLTGQENALFNLYRALPQAIEDFMENISKEQNETLNSVLSELEKETNKSNRSILDQITFENFHYYSGFEEL